MLTLDPFIPRTDYRYVAEALIRAHVEDRFNTHPDVDEFLLPVTWSDGSTEEIHCVRGEDPIPFESYDRYLENAT